MSKEEGNELYHSTLTSVTQVIPVLTEIKPPNVLQQVVIHSEISVLVGFTGDIGGRMMIEGTSQTFSKLGESMFGMPLEGEMLHSFVGELANMIAGHTSTIICKKGHSIDITPPTVLVGPLQLYGFDRGLSVPIQITGVGNLNIILLMQNQGVA